MSALIEARRPAVRVRRGAAHHSILRTVAFAGDIATLTDVKRAEDPFLMNNLDHAVSVAGGPIVDLLSNPDMSTLKPLGTLFIVEHGAPGVVESGLNGKQIAAILDKALSDDFVGTIYLSVCFSGSTNPTGAITRLKAPTSLATDLKTELDRLGGLPKRPESRKAITVIGAKGPTITNKLLQGGGDITVDLDVSAVDKIAAPIQTKLKDEQPYKKIFEDWETYVKTGPGKGRKLDHLVGIAAVRFKPFYDEFIKRLGDTIGTDKLKRGAPGHQVLKGDTTLRQKVVDKLYG